VSSLLGRIARVGDASHRLTVDEVDREAVCNAAYGQARDVQQRAFGIERSRENRARVGDERQPLGSRFRLRACDLLAIERDAPRTARSAVGARKLRRARGGTPPGASA